VAHVGEPGDRPLAEDTRIGEYRIRGLLGEGAMGQVYLAQDTTLGRRVALKLIRRSAMQAEAVDAFLREARTTASFNHPHVVTLHAVGRYDGRPYLALEYLDGETLRARLAGGPIPEREALRYARAIAEALADAHQRGLIHADLKPENVMIPRDGRLRVLDFGLARIADGSPDSAAGTPAYMAPERWRRAPLARAIDVWAFGTLLSEMITGQRPLADAQLGQLAFGHPEPLELALPAAPWAALARDCLALDAAARPSADDLVRRVGALLESRATPADDADPHCPFPGLAAFTREHARDYFGRRAELDALIEQLRARPLVPIAGASGLGKSSFVRAALLPRLEETGRWTAVTLRPGAAPFEQLAAALAIPGRPAASAAAQLRAHPDSLSLLLGEVARERGGQVLLFIDQFEEVFTLATDPAEALAFCDRLARAAAPREPWRVVITLRDDFLGRLAAAPAMRPHLGAVVVLGPLAAADLREAVTGPLANVGYRPDAPELIDRIVAEVDGQPACLPLLQFACRSLWDRRDPVGHRILAAEYQAMGGATGALAKHAQRLLGELTVDETRHTRGLLLALLRPDGTRRPRTRAELLDGLEPASRSTAERVLERLLEHRLVVTARDPIDEQVARYEVAHEALATAWPQLARWLDETYEERLLVAELEHASRRWESHGRRDDETWSGVALADAVRKVEVWRVALPSTARDFLAASRARDRRQRRRRQIAIAGTIAALALAAAGAVRNAIVVSREAELRAAVAADRGRVRLVLRPFDWDGARPVAPELLPPLRWSLHRPAAEPSLAPGAPLGPYELIHGEPAWRGGALTEEIEVRSGRAILVVSRGACPDSVLRLASLPGYRDRDAPTTYELRVPTCQATAAGMVEIPAGPFYDESDELRDHPAYAIDRTEVTRGAFALFDAIAPITGHQRAGPPSHLQLDPARAERYPITGITHATAEAYCAYLGKALPSVAQWLKAARGGLAIGGRANPEPRRRTPWGAALPAGPVNVHAADGPERRLAPVGTHAGDLSPYQIVDLTGNASEWSREAERGLRRVLGGDWDTPLHSNGIATTNLRPAETISYSIGIRCVTR
jgi:tRNA A-37 threonylcarbamoyl transferase component Bud32